MKALSIIGIVVSALMGLSSMAVSSKLILCCQEPAPNLGLLLLIFSLYFLAFSITSTVVSFKKKK